jgi:hypothetical protein
LEKSCKRKESAKGMTNEEIVIFKAVCVIAAVVVMFVAVMVYQYYKQEKTIISAFKRVPVLGAILIFFGIDD